MALFKILRGPSNELTNLPINDGYCYFTPDTGLFHIDYSGNRVPLNANGLIDQNTGELVKIWHGTTAEYEALEEKDDNTIYVLADEVGGNIVANSIEYDNSVSGLFATNVQAAIDEVSIEKQNKITGTAGQMVGFDADGNAIAVDKPYVATIRVW